MKDSHRRWWEYMEVVHAVTKSYCQRIVNHAVRTGTVGLIADVHDPYPTPHGSLTLDSQQRFRTKMQITTMPGIRFDTLIDTGNASESIMPKHLFDALVERGLPADFLFDGPPKQLMAANGTPIHVSKMVSLPIQVADPTMDYYTPSQMMQFYVLDVNYEHVLIASKHVIGSIGGIVKRLIDYYSGETVPEGMVHMLYPDGSVTYGYAACANASVVATVEVTKQPGEPITYSDIFPLINNVTEGHLDLDHINLSLMTRCLHSETPADVITDQLAAVTPRPDVPVDTGTGLQQSTPIAPSPRPSTMTKADMKRKIEEKLRYLRPKATSHLYDKLYKLMLDNYTVLFDSMGCFKNVSASIELMEGARKILAAFQGDQYRPIKKEYEAAVRDNIDVLLLNGIIKEITPAEAGRAPFISPAHVVLKAPKPDGTMQVRITVDMRHINDVTIKETPRHRIPTTTAKFEEITGRKILVVADLRSAFHLVPLDPKSQENTTFRLGNRWFKYLRLPMGAANSSITFNSLCVEAFPSFYSYCDDIVFGADTEDEAITKLHRLFTQALENGASFDIDKLKIGPTVKVLGFATDGIKRWFGKEDKSALSITSKHLQMRRLDDVRAFIGVAMWYSPFLPNINIVLSPLRLWLATAKRVADLTPACELAIRRTQNLILEAQPLWLPVKGKPFYIATDASNVGLSGVLMQMHPVADTAELSKEQLARSIRDLDGTLMMPRPVAYWSELLSEQDKNLNVTEREALALLHSTLAWRDELQGSRVIMFSDHANLAYMFTSSNLLVRRAAAQMCSFLHPVFIHIAGKNNQLADFMSRVFIDERRFPSTEQTMQVAAIMERAGEPCSPRPPAPVNLPSPVVASIYTASGSSSSLPATSSTVHTTTTHTTAEAVYSVSVSPAAEGPDIYFNLQTGISRRVVATVSGETPVQNPLEAYFTHDLRNEPGVFVLTRSSATRITANTIEHLDADVPTSNPSTEMQVDVTEIEEEPELVQLTKWRAPILQQLAVHGRLQHNALPPFVSAYPGAVLTQIRQHKVWVDVDGRLIVPEGDFELQNRILLASHEDANHCGIHQTQRNAHSFIWPNLLQDAKRYVERCPQCQISRVKGTNQPHGMYIIKPEGWPGQRVIIDTVGPFPVCDGFQYIITIVDSASRFKYSEPTTSNTAAAAMAVLLRWCMLYGIPDIVQSDNGSNYTSSEFGAFLQTLGIQQYTSKAYHAQSQARQERQTREMKHAMTAYAGENNSNWVDSLFRYQNRCNLMINRSIGISPMTAFLGREAKTPSNIAAGQKLYDPKLSTEGLLSFLAHNRAIHSKTYQQSLLSQAAYKAAYDAKRVSLALQPGDHVIAIEPTAHGIAAGWQGPFVVVEQVKDRENSYHIKHLVKDKTMIVHEQRLRRFDPSRMTESDLRQLSDCKDGEFLIEAIREVVIQGNGDVMVLVKWRYEDSPTWQKLADMTNSSTFTDFLLSKGYKLNKAKTKVVKVL